MQTKRKKDLLNGNILEQMAFLFVPVFFNYLLLQVYTLVDSIVVGIFVGKAALAAVGGSSKMVVGFLINFLSGLGTGAGIVVAHAYGKRDYNVVHNAVKTSIFVAFIAGAFFTIAPILVAKQMFVMMAVPEEILSDSIVYLKLNCYSMIPYAIYVMGLNVYRAVGDFKKQMIFAITMCIFKVGLNILLTAVLNMGVLGVSIATAVSYTLRAIVVLYCMIHEMDCFGFSFKEFGFEKNCLKEMMVIGISSAIQNVLYSITSIYIQMKINLFDIDTIAAYSAFNNIDNFYWAFSNSLGSVLMTMVGQNFGHGNKKRVKKIMMYTFLIHFVVSILYGLAFINYSTALISLINTDPDVINIAKEMMFIVASMYWTYSLIEVISLSLKACNSVKAPMIITAIGICAFRIIYNTFIPQTSYIIPMISFPASWIITGISLLMYYIFGFRKKLQEI